ncbi:MAG TPA: PIN domain-containing protein [Ktedonobacterales bacterium]|nr:PIN domain-containing protein [Ktedonobacterales bacterium]
MLVGALIPVAIAANDTANRNSAIANLPNWKVWVVAAAVVCGIIGYIIAPWVVINPARWVYNVIRRSNVSDILSGVIGLIIGLIIAALLTLPISQLKFLSLGTWLPTIVALACGSLGVAVAVLLKQDFIRLATVGLANRAGRRAEREERERDADEHEERDETPARDSRGRAAKTKGQRSSDRVLVDTSAIIDGRIADIGQTGFITGTLVVPRFVLEELQHIADSADSLRRNRGRRGLEILGRLQKETTVPVEISDADAEGTHEVDAKLVKLARQWHCSIITNDFNLNRVAALQGVKVLNINELAHAVKPILLPGEEMAVKIIQDGKELGQGVGYLDDGTMIVVEGGKQFIGTALEVTVTRVLQTIAGRMIFAQPKQSQGVGPASAGRRAEA